MSIVGGGKNEELRRELLQFFLKQHTMDTVVLYENSQLYGTVSYQSLIRCQDLNKAINRNFIILNEEIWENAKEIFQNTKERFLPVIDINGKLDCFCYQDEKTVPGTYNFLNCLLNTNNKLIWLDSIYPKMKVIRIWGMNEYSYIFFKVCCKYGSLVCLEGERWKILNTNPSVDISQFPDYSILNIYSDGAYPMKVENEYGYYPYPPGDIWWKGLLFGLMTKNYRIAHEKLISQITNKQIICGILIIPGARAVFMTAEEQRCARFRNEMNSFNEISAPEYTEAPTDLFYGRDTPEALKGKNCEGNVDEYYYEGFGEYSVSSTKPFVNSYKRKRIYLVGPCIAGGDGVSAENSLNGVLQHILDEYYPDEYLVVSKFIARGNPVKIENALSGMRISSRDIIIIVEENNMLGDLRCIPENIKALYAKDIYTDTLRESMFFDKPIHSNYNGNKKLAELLYKEVIQPNYVSLDKSSLIIQKGKILSKEEEEKLTFIIHNIQEYLKKPVCCQEKVGAVVMNCNPFTFGHLYLIKQASPQVDRLIIFVVEEDKSFFSFKDRIAMVRDGVRHFENIEVVPSGQFILSYKTLSAYFEKEWNHDAVLDATNDLRLFCEYVAPAFHISVRFAGEEPFDLITRQYNEQMKDICQCYNIDFREIKRLKKGEEIISASNVRRYIQNGDWENIKNIVPQTTLPYISPLMDLKEAGMKESLSSS